MKICISSGHGKHIRGASCILDEVDEARKVVDSAAEMLESRGVKVVKFHDDVSTTQSENLNRIVNFHNAQNRELDI
jgi:N-acetylmuramoyl-L-alanine amidase